MVIGWIYLFEILVIAKSSENQKESFVDDIEVIALERRIIDIKKDIINLQNDHDTKENEKEMLILYQKNINNITSVFDQIHLNTTFYYFYDEKIVENVNNNINELRDSIDIIKEEGQVRKVDRMTQECIEDIKKGNYGFATNKISLINDRSKTEKIIKEVYKDKNNFNNILKFGDEIPSISLTLVVYKSLLNEIEKDNYILYLDLIYSIKTQVLDQLAVDSLTRIEAEEILYNIQKPVGTWIADKLGKAVIHNRPDIQIDEIIKRMVYEIKYYKFFREIADISVLKYFPKNTTNETYFDNLFTFELSDMQDVPLLIMYQSFLDHIYQNLNAYSKPYSKLVLLQKSIETSYKKLRKDFKNIEQNSYDIRLFLSKLVSDALLHEFYNEPFINNVLLETILYRGHTTFIIDIISSSIMKVYGKKRTHEIVDMLAKTPNSIISNTGIVFISNTMEIYNGLELKPENLAAMLTLNKYLSRILETPGIKNYEVTLLFLLQHFHDLVKYTKFNASEIFNDGLLKNTYTTTYYKDICIELSNAQAFEYMIKKLADSHFDNFDTQKLLDYVLFFPNFDERLIGLNMLQRKTYKNSVYLFEIAEVYKKMMATKEYDKIKSRLKVDNERALKTLPISIRNVVFAKEVYIKNLLEGGEYLYADHFSDNKRDIFTRVSWKRGNNTKWAIENTKESGIYKIKNLQFDEYLYASETLVDKNSRQVFLGSRNSNGDKWRFIPIDDGLYLKNMLYKEYLYAASGRHIRGKESRPVFTWLAGVVNNRGGWKIEDATTDY